MTATYEKIATTTLGSDQATVTFSSIPGTYTDLVLITNEKQSGARASALQFNSDTGSNYTQTGLYGNGSATGSYRTTSTTLIYYSYYAASSSTNFNMNSIVQINNYSNTTTYKNVLSRANNADLGVDAIAALWRNTAAITSITLTMESLSNYKAGCTFTLYGIKAE